MNNVTLIGRLTSDPVVRYTGEQLAIASFAVAIDRAMSKEKKTDFIQIKVFGRQAENCEKYLSKGSQVGIIGEIQSGSYEKDGKKVYTTEVLASRVEFLGSKPESAKSEPQADIPSGFEYATVLESEIPF